MQSLESRITAIESKDNSLDVSALNNSLDSPSCASHSVCQRQNLPVRFSVNQGASLQNTPVKPRKSLSFTSTPAECTSQNCNNSLRNDTNLGCYIGTTAISNTVNTNSPARAKLDALTSRSDPSVVPPALSCGTGLSHAMSCRRESLSLRPSDRCTDTSNLYSTPHASLHSTVPGLSNLPNASIGHTSRSRIVQEMELSEVDELLQEMEATELELSKRINSGYQYRNEPVYSMLFTQPVDTASNQEEKAGPFRKLDFQSSKESQLVNTSLISPSKKSNNIFPDISLPYGDSFHLNETEKMITEFKAWEQSAQQSVPASNGYATESTNSIKNTDYLSTNISSTVLDNTKSKESLPDRNIAFTKASKLSEVTQQKAGQYDNTERLLNYSKTPQGNGNMSDRTEFSKSTVHVGTNTDSYLK